MTARSKKRADSRAHEECPECGKRLHGMKGLAAHRAAAHGDSPSPLAAQAVSPTEGGDLERVSSAAANLPTCGGDVSAADRGGRPSATVYFFTGVKVDRP
jgi:hypothetical protein